MTIYDALLLAPMAIVVVGLWIDLITTTDSDSLFEDISKSNNNR
mgnify:CR=1 FL=1